MICSWLALTPSGRFRHLMQQDGDLLTLAVHASDVLQLRVAKGEDQQKPLA